MRTPKKSAAAVALGKARWKGRTKAERSAHMKMMRAVRTLKAARKIPA